MAIQNILPEDWVVPELDGRGNGPYGLLHLLRWRIAEKFKADVMHPERAQRNALRRILQAARGTDFGAKHGLDRVETYFEYREAVPVRSSHEFEPWLARTANGDAMALTNERVRSFVKTSGTTGCPKLLPVTDTWAKKVRDGQLLWTMGMLKEQEAVAHGKALTTLGQVNEGQTSLGVHYGSNTGRMGKAQPWWVRHRMAIPPSVATLTEVEVRHYAWLRMALSAKVTSWTTANPSMVLALCRKLQEWREPLSADLQHGTLCEGPGADVPDRFRKQWEKWLKRRTLPTDWNPLGFWDLATVNCWTGGPASYFVERLPMALGGDVPIRDVGLTASEGYFAFPLHSSWRGGVAWVGGHFMELLSTQTGEVVPIYEAKLGEQYRLVLSTTAGLYRYDINDVVEVVGRYGATPVVRFVGKGGDVLSVVGEKVTAAQASEVFAQVLPKSYHGDACVSVEMGLVPTYLICVEAQLRDAVANAFDVKMMALNMEYASKRETGRLGSPRICVLPEGTLSLERLRKSRMGVADGQVKDTWLVEHELLKKWLRSGEPS